MIGLCLMGHTGAGKSTLARLVCEAVTARGHRAAVLKLADPLYRLQREVYAVAGRTTHPGQQDQLLMEDLARHLRRIRASALADDFEVRLRASAADVVVNEDLRDVDVDYPRLRDLGFRFVRVTADEGVRLGRLAGRRDLSTVTDSATTRRISAIPADLVIDNSGNDLDELTAAVLPRVLAALGFDRM